MPRPTVATIVNVSTGTRIRPRTLMRTSVAHPWMLNGPGMVVLRFSLKNAQDYCPAAGSSIEALEYHPDRNVDLSKGPCPLVLPVGPRWCGAVRRARRPWSRATTGVRSAAIARCPAESKRGGNRRRSHGHDGAARHQRAAPGSQRQRVGAQPRELRRIAGEPVSGAARSARAEERPEGYERGCVVEAAPPRDRRGLRS